MGDVQRANRKITEPKLSTIAEGIAKLKRYERVKEEPIEIGQGRTLILSDIHIPFHDPVALKTAIQAGKDFDADHVILNGDIIDCYMISRFTKEPGRFSFKVELDITRGFLEFIRSEFPKARIVYKEGNHEARLRLYLLQNADKIADLEDLELGSLLRLENLGIEYVRNERTKLGALNVLHGHELPHGISAPVNPARGVFLRAKSSTLVGHHHQTSNHAEGNLDGARMACWSTGCLCDLQPDYNYFAALKWTHGFALVESEDNGSFTVYNKQIIDGKIH